MNYTYMQYYTLYCDVNQLYMYIYNIDLFEFILFKLCFIYNYIGDKRAWIYIIILYSIHYHILPSLFSVDST